MKLLFLPLMRRALLAGASSITLSGLVVAQSLQPDAGTPTLHYGDGSAYTGASPIEVRFPRAIVAPDQVGRDAAASPIAFTPLLEGRFTWRSQRSGTFTPSGVVPLSVEYSVTTAAGLHDAEGAPWPVTNLGTIATERARALRQVPRYFSRQNLPRKLEVVHFFNTEVDLESARRNMRFQSDDGTVILADVRFLNGSELPDESIPVGTRDQQFRGERPEVEPDKPVRSALAVKPALPLPQGDNWKILWDPIAIEGGGMTEAESGLLLGTVPAFLVTSNELVQRYDAQDYIEVGFNKPLGKDLTAEKLRHWLEIRPEPANLSIVVEERSLRLNGDFALTPYQIEVAPGLPAADGSLLQQRAVKTHEVKAMPPHMSVPAFGATQYAHGNKSFEIIAANLATVRLRVKQVDARDAARALAAYALYEANPERGENTGETLDRVPFQVVPGKTVCDETFASGVGLDESDKLVIHWDDILGARVDAALLFVSVEGVVKPEVVLEGNRERGTMIAQSLLQITDIGLAWKRSRDDVLVYAFSQHTGRPLPGVTFRRYDSDASLLDGALQTDSNGLASVPVAGAHWMVASTGTDAHAIAFGNNLPQLSMWQFGVPVEWRDLARQYREAQIFTDRPLYKPEETVHLKCLTRMVQGPHITLPDSCPATLKAYDPEGRLFLTRDISFSERGSFTGAIDLPGRDTGLGAYRLEITFEDADSSDPGESRRTARTFDHYIFVQEFKANAFAVEMTAGESDSGPGAVEVAFPLSAHYLMGKPLAKARVEWSATIEDTALWSEKWPGFGFGDQRSEWVYADGSYREFAAVSARVRSHALSGNAGLDDAGGATVVVPVAFRQEMPSRRTVSVTASVTDINQQTISASATKVIESSDFYLGLRAAERVMKVGVPNPVEMVAVTPDEVAFTGTVQADVRIEKLLWNSVKVEGAGGAITTKNFVSVSEVQSQTVTLGPDAPGMASITPDAPGTYVVTVAAADPAGRPVVSAMTITAYGEGDTYWFQNDGIRIDLQADKESYLPGEEAIVVVKSAVHGSALVTVERDSVRSRFVTEITSDAQPVPIPLGVDDTPNVFVSVLLVRGGADSGRQYPFPEYRLGYCELKVRNTTDGLDVHVATDAAAYRPGTTVTATATVKDPRGRPVPDAEVTVYAVDQGVLDLMPYQLPDPFGFFHQPQRLAVSAGSSLSGLLAENPDDRAFGNKGTIIGGGGLMGMPKGQMRKNFKACAFWNGELVTGENGTITATFVAPDNLTEYHLFAVASEGAARFGGGESKLLVNKPLMLEPALPRFANVGDHIIARGVVHNTSPHGGEFSITLEVDTTADHAEEPREPVRSQRLALAPGASGTVTFPVAMKAVGEAVWQWSVAPSSAGDPALKELVDRVESRFPVTLPVPELRESHYRVANGSDPGNNLLRDVDPEMLEGDGEIVLTVSTSPLINGLGAIEQVLRYPYGCIEQTTSATLPWISLRDLSGVLPGLQKSDAEIDDAIRGGCKRLLSMQTRSGGLGYWPGAEQPMLWGSAYAGMVLALAREQGVVLPEERLESLCGYLSAQLRDTGKADDDRELGNRCLAAYTLALFDKAEPAYHASLGEKAASISASGRAFLALAILQSGGSRAQAQALLEMTPPEDEGILFYDPAAAATTVAWCRLAPGSERLSASVQQLIGKRSLRGDWHNTYLNGWGLLALGEFTRATSQQHGNIEIEATLNGMARRLQIDNESRPSVRTTFAFGSGDAPDTLQLKSPAGMTLYTVVDVTAKPRIVPQEARSSGDFRLTRTYEELENDGTRLPPSDLQVGDLVLVTLEGEVTPRSEFIVIDDALPAILEAINPAFQSREATAEVPQGSFRWFSDHQELRTERTLYFRDYVYGGGKFSIQYLARVIAEGTVTAPPAKVEAMYDPGKRGLSASMVLTATSGN